MWMDCIFLTYRVFGRKGMGYVMLNSSGEEAEP